MACEQAARAAGEAGAGQRAARKACGPGRQRRRRRAAASRRRAAPLPPRRMRRARLHGPSGRSGARASTQAELSRRQCPVMGSSAACGSCGGHWRPAAPPRSLESALCSPPEPQSKLGCRCALSPGLCNKGLGRGLQGRGAAVRGSAHSSLPCRRAECPLLGAPTLHAAGLMESKLVELPPTDLPTRLIAALAPGAPPSRRSGHGPPVGPAGGSSRLVPVARRRV